MDNETTEEPTAAVLKWLDAKHGSLKHCPTCGENCSTTGLTKIAYYFTTCECGEPEYPHLVEQLTHLSCLASDGAIEPATRAMLESARHVLGRYKLGKATAAEIGAFLDRNVPVMQNNRNPQTKET